MLVSHHSSEREQVCDHVRFDLLIQRRVTAHSWGQIDLKDPWLQLAVHKHVKSKQLKAIVLRKWTIHLIRIIDHVFAANHRFDNQISNLGKKKLVIQTHPLQAFPQRSNRLLRTSVVFRRIRVILEVGSKLVETVIGQVSEFGLFASLAEGLVLLGGETHQAIFVHVQTQWINRGQCDIDSQVKFVSIYQQRVVDVLACHHLLLLRDFLEVLSYENAPALAARRRFYDPHFVGVCSHVVLKADVLSRKDVSIRQEPEVLLAMLLLHVGKMPVHAVFPCDLRRLREVVHLLESGHSLVQS